MNQEENTMNSGPSFCCWVHWLALAWNRLTTPVLSLHIIHCHCRQHTVDSEDKGSHWRHCTRPKRQRGRHHIPQTSPKLVHLRIVLKKVGHISSHQISLLPMRNDIFIAGVCCSLPSSLPVCLHLSLCLHLCHFYPSLPFFISLSLYFLQNQ